MSGVKRMQPYLRQSLLWLLLSLSSGLLLAAQTPPFAGKKVMLVNSYHQGYGWSDGISTGVHEILDMQGVQVRDFWMDTKRNHSEAFKKKAALKAKQAIEQWRPDLIIAADDNASKYLIKPYFKDSAIPVVFCGVNWDASVYGYPYTNATGMEEVSLIAPLPGELARFAHGERLGILTGTVLSDRKNVENFKKKMGIHFDQEVYVESFEQWKQQFRALQQRVDILIMENSQSISGWNDTEAQQFVLDNTRIPTGSTQPGMVPYVLIGYSQVPQEQGIYAAKTALRIFSGEKPSAIPIVNNHQAQVWLNLRIAQKLGIVFPLSMLKNAEIYR